METKEIDGYICEDCSQFVEYGLTAAIKHTTECTKDCPSTDIEEYRRKEKALEIINNNPHRKKFLAAMPNMTEEQIEEYTELIIVGIPLGVGAVYFGSNMMEKIRSFEEEMIEMYSHYKDVEVVEERFAEKEFKELMKEKLKDYPDPEEVKDKRQQNKLRSRFHR